MSDILSDVHVKIADAVKERNGARVLLLVQSVPDDALFICIQHAFRVITHEGAVELIEFFVGRYQWIFKRVDSENHTVLTRTVLALEKGVPVEKIVRCIKRLVDLGAEPTHVDSNGNNAAALALLRGAVPVAHAILDECDRAAVNVKMFIERENAQGNSLFSLACARGCKQFVLTLLTRGANPTRASSMTGKTPLEDAFTFEHFEIVDLLARHVIDGKCEFSLSDLHPSTHHIMEVALTRALHCADTAASAFIEDQSLRVMNPLAMACHALRDWFGCTGAAQNRETARALAGHCLPWLLEVCRYAPFACYLLAVFELCSVNMLGCRVRSEHYLDYAVHHGNPSAMTMQADAILKHPANLRQASDLYSRAAKLFHAPAMFKMGRIYEECGNVEEAAPMMVACAHLRLSVALVPGALHSIFYYRTIAHCNQAVHFLAAAKALKVPGGSYWLAFCYEKGKGAEINPIAVVEHHEIASSQGYLRAQIEMAFFKSFHAHTLHISNELLQIVVPQVFALARTVKLTKFVIMFPSQAVADPGKISVRFYYIKHDGTISGRGLERQVSREFLLIAAPVLKVGHTIIKVRQMRGATVPPGFDNAMRLVENPSAATGFEIRQRRWIENCPDAVRAAAEQIAAVLGSSRDGLLLYVRSPRRLLHQTLYAPVPTSGPPAALPA